MRYFVVCLLSLAGLPSYAELLPDLPRAITRTDSAERDAPALELSADGRAHAKLAGELGLWRWQQGDWQIRLLADVLIAADNVRSPLPIPDELARWQFGAALVAAVPLHTPDGMLEFGLGLSRQQAKTIGNFVMNDPIRADSLAFGGNGLSLDVDLALRRRLGPMRLTLRLNDRWHLPGLVALFGPHAAAELVSDFLGDGLSHAPGADVTLRWPISPNWQPLWALHSEFLVPLDYYVAKRGYLRTMLGVALPGQHGEFVPFVALDVGSGAGLLVNREALRFVLGVRYVSH